MADDKSKTQNTANSKKERNAVADGHNWEQRVRSELEAPHKWNETWGEYFKGDVPLEYNERIEYLEKELKKYPASSIHPPKYGIGQPFNTIGPDHRRKKLFFDRLQEEDI